MTGGESRFFIRRMKPEDVSRVLEIERLSFSNPWSRETFQGEIQNDIISHPIVVVERPEDEVVGYVIYWQVQDDVQINNVAVHPDCRGRGIGEALLSSVIEKMKDGSVGFISLEVRCSNAPALGLYGKLGFRIIGKRKKYYTNPEEDAYVMGLTPKARS